MLTIGLFGYISVMSLLAFGRKPGGLVRLMIFFAPFITCSVISTQSFYLKPAHFFLFIILISSIVVACAKAMGNGDFWVILTKPNIYLCSFIIVAIISIFNSLMFHIDEEVVGIGNGLQLKSSLVSKQNMTQLLYLICGFFCYYIIINYIKLDRKKWDEIIFVLVVSGTCVALVGIYQIIANRFRLPFQMIFKASSNEMWQTMTRLQSTMNEASIFGQFCVYMLVVILWSDTVIKRMGGWRYLLAILFAIDGVMTRSTTFMVGAVAILSFYWLLQAKRPNRFWGIFFCMCALAGIVVLLYNYNFYMRAFIDSAVDKFTGKSRFGINRMNIFIVMVKVWLRHPIFGIGFGGGRSTDLYASILCTTGLVGVTALFLFIFSVVSKIVRNRSGSESKMCLMMIIAFLATSVSVPDMIFMPLWVIFAIVDMGCELH